MGTCARGCVPGYRMIEGESIEHEITVRLTKDGKLPREIVCPLCCGTMRRLWTRNTPTYKCRWEECQAMTTLDTLLR